MKKIIVAVVVVVVLAMTALASTYRTDLFKAVKSSNFRLEMTTRRAESLFSDFELANITEAEKEGNILTVLTYTTGDFKETLKLTFTNDKLHSFDYDNFELTLELLEIDLDFLSD